MLDSAQPPTFRYATFFHSALAVMPSLWLLTVLFESWQQWNGLCFRLMFLLYPVWVVLLPILILFYAVRSPKALWPYGYLLVHVVVYVAPVLIFLADPARRATLVF
ncbi:hypothetical protein IQ266_21860 [filamentous cyanobacterium LEGE 11480]|uniref:Uncharacterized protein n=1 Tax=Romeriopsis navalis LEGE 11480 TaxID=2777977 RepID=A0A928Z696_9CYAN|nr:hypothetical protein [Romeriopsis navalis]MBE9032388.1 hypothetical protein [Romeriopsis navalis LEGE 11480]